jgi:hypothetical protein
MTAERAVCTMVVLGYISPAALSQESAQRFLPDAAKVAAHLIENWPRLRRGS